MFVVRVVICNTQVGGGVYSGGQAGYSGNVSGVNNNIKDLTQVGIF